MEYKKNLYDLIDIKISTLKNKKYDAFIRNKKTGKIIKIPFGQKGYEHYRDTTPLKYYKNFDHNNIKRLNNYRSRFKRMFNNDYFSPTYFSWTYLWS